MWGSIEDAVSGCKHALLHVRTVTPKGSVTEKLYSQPPCSIYIHIGRCSKQQLTVGCRGGPERPGRVSSVQTFKNLHCEFCRINNRCVWLGKRTHGLEIDPKSPNPSRLAPTRASQLQ